MLIQLCLSALVAVVVSAFCSIAEAALYSIPISYIEVLVKSGKKSGAILKELKNDITRPIIAILTLNTIANTMGAALAGASAAAYFDNQYVGWFSAIFTLTILFFSEIIPKTAGVTYCKELAPFLSYPIIGLVKLFSPIVWICNQLTRMIDKGTEQPFVTSGEIKVIAKMSQRSGEIDRQEEKIIINILELKNKTVRKAMTPRTVVFTLSEHLKVEEAAELRDKWNQHSRVPVFGKDADDITGTVLRKDVLLNAAEGKIALKLSNLKQPPHFVPESAPLPSVLLDFFEQRQHLFVVVDEYGTFTGIITLEDIIEEIMGEEIMDESDKTRDMRALARFKRISASKYNTKVEK